MRDATGPVEALPYRLERRRLLFSFAFALSALFILPTTTIPQETEVFLRAAHWLDVSAGELRGPIIVQISNGRIVKLSTPAPFQIPASSHVVDLGNATLLPGLIDAHVHLQLGGALPRDNARAVLQAGFTTVVDQGATTDIVLRLRDRIASGAIEGPRILAAGRWIGKQGGICEFGGIGIAGGPDAYRARVRENIVSGADFSKICVSTWLDDAFQRPDAYEIADDALTAVVEESHRAGQLVLAHAISLGAVKAAVRSGVNGLAHAAYVDKPTAMQLRERRVFMVPTLASLVGQSKEPAAEALRRSVAVAYAAQVPIVFGTDGGVLPHGRNAVEFVALVDAGIPPIGAIRAATMTAARELRLAEVGEIKAGFRADLIAVDGDPLQSVQALSRVVFVMREGRVVGK